MILTYMIEMVNVEEVKILLQVVPVKIAKAKRSHTVCFGITASGSTNRNNLTCSNVYTRTFVILNNT